MTYTDESNREWRLGKKVKKDSSDLVFKLVSERFNYSGGWRQWEEVEEKVRNRKILHEATGVKLFAGRNRSETEGLRDGCWKIKENGDRPAVYRLTIRNFTKVGFSTIFCGECNSVILLNDRLTSKKLFSSVKRDNRGS